MGVLDRLASAEVSSDLQHHEHTCDVDTIGAAGMAAARYMCKSRPGTTIQQALDYLDRKYAEQCNRVPANR